MQQAGHRPRDPLGGLVGSVSAHLCSRFCSGFVSVGVGFGSVSIIRSDVVHILSFRLVLVLRLLESPQLPSR